MCFLRIEDSDKERSSEESIESIINGLEWLGINFSKPIMVRGSPGDLKNNFKYKVVSSDADFKKVSDAVITSNNQIKLKIDKDIAKDQTVLIKYEQNKEVSKGIHP